MLIVLFKTPILKLLDKEGNLFGNQVRSLRLSRIQQLLQKHFETKVKRYAFRTSARTLYDTKTFVSKCFMAVISICDSLSDVTWFPSLHRSSSTVSISIFLKIASGKRAFWMANTLDPFARGLHSHVSLIICTFARFNKNSDTRDQNQQQTGLYQPYEVSNA